MDNVEYLLSYGLLGDFGRFRAVRPLPYRRKDRVVAKTHRGLEIAEVLRTASPGHAVFLPNTTVGQLLRLATTEDEITARQMHKRSRTLLDRGNALAHSLGLSLELLDAEIVLDGQHGVLHQLRWEDADVRPFVSTLSREFELHIELADLSQASSAEPDEDHGCGREGCGTGGGCGSCGTGGGCSTCGVAKHDHVKSHVADLKSQTPRHALL